MSEWIWEPDDFAALWFRAENDRFPRPLHYRSRFAYLEDFARHRAKVRTGYSADELEEIELALHTLTTSDMRIEILGGTTKTTNAKTREYRIVGARNPYHAVVLSQSAVDGEDGSIRLRLCQPEHLPSRIINWLLPSEPGREPPASFHRQDITQRHDDYSDGFRSTAREQYQRLVGRPTDGGGSAGLRVGSILDRPEPWNTLRWYDVSGDGRYTEQRTTEHVKVRPTTPQDLAVQFATWIDRAVHRLREDDLDAW